MGEGLRDSERSKIARELDARALWSAPAATALWICFSPANPNAHQSEHLLINSGSVPGNPERTSRSSNRAPIRPVSISINQKWISIGSVRGRISFERDSIN
jgi:hypothetical protein